MDKLSRLSKYSRHERIRILISLPMRQLSYMKLIEDIVP